MSNLVTTSRNGSLANRRSNANFPSFSSFLDDFFTSDFPSLFSPNFDRRMTTPMVNVKENEDAYIVEMAAPGMNKKDFQIDLDNDVLTISAELNTKNEETSELFTRREFEYTSFQRSFRLPDTVNQGKIKANYKEGILNVQLPKKEEAKKLPARKIDIS
jgi:HSP20 family protein